MTSNMPKTLTGLSLLLLTVFAAVTGNETILPSALVALGIFLRSSGKPSQGQRADVSTGKAARYAITTYAAFVALNSLLMSLFLSSVSNYFGWDGWFKGDFVRVTINDAHEFAYATCLLLLINAAYFFYFRFKTGLLRKGSGPLQAQTGYAPK